MKLGNINLLVIITVQLSSCSRQDNSYQSDLCHFSRNFYKVTTKIDGVQTPVNNFLIKLFIFSTTLLIGEYMVASAATNNWGRNTLICTTII